MPTDILTTLAAASGAIALAVTSYWFTKKREREAELRKEKLDHYKEFVASLSGILDGEGTPEGQRAFARACNKLNLVAPQTVILALQKFQQEIKVTNQAKSRQRHDELMSRLFYEIRKDLQIKPEDTKSNFQVGLWAAGVPPEQS
jgi:hypothetical protein